MSQFRPDGGFAIARFLHIEGQNRFEKLLTLIIQISGIGLFGVAPILSIFDNKISEKYSSVILAGMGVCLVLFCASFCILGIKIAGGSLGKRTFVGQSAAVLGKVFLYLFLPCLVITLIMLLVAWKTGNLVL